MQEYGDECDAPNRNTCYLSYLDSVKYFRPELKSVLADVALRTLVYHEILLAYMEHAKQLGMNAMYIWSCPPLAVRLSLLACCGDVTLCLPALRGCVAADARPASWWTKHT
jgi:E1A/CREB-binding protein